MNNVKIYDTTLRDGNQTSSISFSLEDKLLITDKLVELGVHYIEGGWPNVTNKTDVEYFNRVKKLGYKSKIVAFGSTRRPNIAPENDSFLNSLIKAETPVITIFGKSWDLHVNDVIRTGLDENLRMVESSIRYLKKYCDEVLFDAEHFFDGFNGNREYAIKVVEAALNGGADGIELCDTNGGMLPWDIKDVFDIMRDRFPNTEFGIHTHNDSGNADANALTILKAGAKRVHGTINGIGERCGNSNLCVVIPNLVLKMGVDCINEEQLSKLTSISYFVNETANILPNVRQPFVGEYAFYHKGGPHIDGVIKNKASFEHIEPEKIGNGRKYAISDQAGGSVIVEKIKKIKPDINKNDAVVKELLTKIKDMVHGGYQFEAAEGSFQLLAQKALGVFKEPFEFKGFRVIIEKNEDGSSYSEATIKVQKGDEIVHTAAEGDGPIDALSKAVRKALVSFYPKLKEVKLEDFKVRILDERGGTSAVVRVLIESHDGKEHWGTVGVSSNIIEASWIALVDSLVYKIMKD